MIVIEGGPSTPCFRFFRPRLQMGKQVHDTIAPPEATSTATNASLSASASPRPTAGCAVARDRHRYKAPSVYGIDNPNPVSEPPPYSSVAYTRSDYNNCTIAPLALLDRRAYSLHEPLHPSKVRPLTPPRVQARADMSNVTMWTSQTSARPSSRILRYNYIHYALLEGPSRLGAHQLLGVRGGRGAQQWDVGEPEVCRLAGWPQTTLLGEKYRKAAVLVQ